MLQAERSLTIIWFSRVAAKSIAGREIARAAAPAPRTKFNPPRALGAGGQDSDSAAMDIDVELFESPAKNMSATNAIPHFGWHR